MQWQIQFPIFLFSSTIPQSCVWFLVYMQGWTKFFMCVWKPILRMLDIKLCWRKGKTKLLLELAGEHILDTQNPGYWSTNLTKPHAQTKQEQTLLKWSIFMTLFSDFFAVNCFTQSTHANILANLSPGSSNKHTKFERKRLINIRAVNCLT